MKLTSMFESASESPVVKCSQDGEKSDQSGALLVPLSADSCVLSPNKSKIKENPSSPVLDMINGDAQADLKKTLEPLTLSNGDGASSDDLERISCRTPVGDNDSSSEKENYLFDDGGSEASLKLRITESEDEGEMSPRATSPFEDIDQECSNQILSEAEDHDGTNCETKDIDLNCDDEQQETEAAEPDVSSPIVKEEDEDNDISGKQLKNEEEENDNDGPGATCVKEEDCCNTHAESAGSVDCISAKLVEPEKSERCCDIASDSETVKCSCDGVCSSTCTCSVSKQEIGSNLTPHSETNISLDLDECTEKHPVTHSREESCSLSTSDSHVSVKECSINSEASLPEDCSSNTILPLCEPTASESEVTTDIPQNTFIDKESISEEPVTDLETAGDLAITNTTEDELSSVEKLECPVTEESANSITGVLSVRENTESNLTSEDDGSGDDGSGDGDDNVEEGDLISKVQDCRSCLVEPVDKANTLEVLPAENGLSTIDEDTNDKESDASVSNNDENLDSAVDVSEVCVKNERGESVDRKDSETELPFTDSKLAASENLVTVANSVTFLGEGSDSKDSETHDMKDSETVKENKLAASQDAFPKLNSATFPGEESHDTNDNETIVNSATFPGEESNDTNDNKTIVNSATFPGEESNDTNDNETVLPLAESKLVQSPNSVTITNSVTFPGEGSNDMKESETVKESKIAESQNSVAITNTVDFPGEGIGDTKDSKTAKESKLAASENSVAITNSVSFAGEGSETLNESKSAGSLNTLTDSGGGSDNKYEKVVLPEGSKSSASQNSITLKKSDVSDDSAVSSTDVSAVSSTDVSQQNMELIHNHVDTCSENLLEDNQAVEMPSAISQSDTNKTGTDKCVDSKEVHCNSTMDDAAGVVIKEKVLLTQESCSSECDKMVDNNDNALMINQTSDPDPGESEREITGSTSSVDVDVNVKDSDTNVVIEGQLKVDGSVEKEKEVDSNMESVSVAHKLPELKNKNRDVKKDCVTSRPPVKLPETGVGGSKKEKAKVTELDRSVVARTSDDTFDASVSSSDIGEPLTLSDVANALKDAVDTVTLQDGECPPFTGCEASLPPLSSEEHNLPPSDMLISDNTSALAVHVADQEVRPENVQEAPGVTEAVRRRRKRSIEDVVPDRISKRTRGATLANSAASNSTASNSTASNSTASNSTASNSAASSPEKLTQTNSESAKRSVVESPVEEEAKRMRLNEEYDKVVQGIEQTVAPNGIVTGDIGSRRVFLEKIRAKDLKNLTVAELEEFFVEKICEALAYRHELGVMRQKQQAVENQMEIWRKKTLTMCKQVRDMELVMKRYHNDLKTRKDRPVIPVKVTRSVGLQVHDVSSDPSRALLHKRKRMEQQASSATLMPRQQSVSVNTNTSTSSPTTANSSRAQQITRSKVASTTGNSPVGAVNKPSRQVIDLTDDGDRGRSAQPRTTAVLTPVNTNTVPANNSVGASTTLTPTSSIRILPQPVTATAVAAGANILAAGVPTTGSVPRLTYLVPTTNQLQQRPVLLASSPSQGVANAVVTVTSGQKNQAPAVYVKNGAVVSVSPLVGSGAVGQQVTSAARPPGLQPSVAQGSPSRPQIRPAQILTGSPQRSLPQHAQHPAPLPVATNLNVNNPELKKMPPRPELKISKQSRHQGIVLSWNMPVTNEYAAIASYQLYAYQESSSPPSTAHWKKVGDVKALPLPMACTLTQFVEGHKYHFAVRAVDIHSRVGPFSLPGSIVLTRK